MKTSTGGKAIDFYTGINLDKLNKDSKPYHVVVKEQAFKNEVFDVTDLKKWEREILTEVHPTYEPDDDSSDEEQIAMRAQKKAEQEAAKAAAEEAAQTQKQGRRK